MPRMDEETYLAHYGILRKSGRYPWGSGGTQSARNRSYLEEVDRLKKTGMTDTEIAKGFGITTTELRAARSIAKTEQRQQQIAQAQRLKDKGYSNVAIGERMNLNESSVRALLAPGLKDRTDVLQTVASMLKEQVDKKGYIDIGVGVENHIGVASTKLSTAVAMLKEQGYTVHSLKVTQLGTGKKTELKVLAKPGVTQKEVWENRADIKQITERSDDGGRTMLGIQPPLSISSKRIGIRYKEDGGAEADGVIYVRPGVKDASLGKGNYAQVRIAVDGSHYLKGMAMYKDDLPAGQDLVFNTNKNRSANKLDVMKPLKDDPDNPFGAELKAGGQQLFRDPKTGKVKVTSAMNVVNEEGDWGSWAKSLSSQMLSKQSPDLAKGQLDMTHERKQSELNEIMALTNPAVKKTLLDKFADSADSSAVHLKAAALPRQGSHVILPVSSMKPTEIYAPNYRDGEKVALIRYPHGGTFEIPELTVNNRNREAKRLLGTNPLDAVGIHHTVAEHLSGADFDGDTVLVIPNNRGSVKTTPALEGLKNFDPRASYPPYEGMRTVDGGVWRNGSVDYEGRRPQGSRKQQLMGDVSNLITDMTIRGANTQELARAVRHSMVVIDSEKHSLDYKASHTANGIGSLKELYQGKPTGAKVPSRAGASTLISKARSPVRVHARKARPAKEGGPIDKATGKRVFVPTGETFVNRKGERVPKTFESRRLAEAADAHTLSSGTPIERVYADHANRLKAMANEARKVSVNTKTIPYDPSAKAVYKDQVESLDHKLNVALRNAPLERQAQVIANSTVAIKRRENPNMDDADLKKIKSQALIEARNRTGAKKQQIQITQQEWDAIQAGAISNNKLTKILDNSDLDVVRQLATPRTKLLMTSSKTNRAKAMLAQGYTQAEVADALGVSLTTLKTGISG